MKCFPQTMYAPTQNLLKGYYKFILRVLDYKNSNFGEVPEDFNISKKGLKEEDVESESQNNLYIMGKEL